MRVGQIVTCCVVRTNSRGTDHASPKRKARDTLKQTRIRLGDGAFKQIGPGDPVEKYKPPIPDKTLLVEVSPWFVVVGLFLMGVFTAAAAYIALRAGSGIEAAVPIAVLAIFLSRLRRQPSTILENVMVQSIGQASGVVAAGATFVIPALYLNQLEVSWWQIFLATAVGGFLGVALIIPLRKYFVREQHGRYPFPEAKGITNVLVAGESGGGSAGKVLIWAFAIGFLFDFMIDACSLWNANFTTSGILGSAGESLNKFGIEIGVSGLAALFGLGYLIGMRYAGLIASGSLLAVLVLVPLVKFVGSFAGEIHYAGKVYNLIEMGPGGVFKAFVQPIGIGAIAAAAILGVLSMWKIVFSSISMGFKGFRRGHQQEETDRRQLDISPKTVLLIQVGASLLLGLVFFLVSMLVDSGGESYTFTDSLIFGLVGMAVSFILSFLFTPVAAQAIAMVGVNPVSGMTLIAVVLAIGAMILTGLKGEAGMIVALIIGTAVCTALSTSGALISDFKVGFWIGSTPRKQEKWKFIGIAVAALVVAFVVPLMDASYHFLVTDPVTSELVSNTKVLPAPQANMIAAVAKGLMDDPANQPWLLYGLGILLTLVVRSTGLPVLAIAMGVYLPVEINLVVLLGAICGMIVSKIGGNKKERARRTELGDIIASGLLAGAAIGGILTAILRLPEIGAPIRYLSIGVRYWLADIKVGSDGTLVQSLKDSTDGWFTGFWGQFSGLMMLLALGLFCYLLASVGSRWRAADELKEAAGSSDGTDAPADPTS